MSPKELTAFRLEPKLMAGLREVKERDGIPFSVQVHRALEAWLESKGVTTWLVEEHERPVNDIQWSQNGMKCLTASDDRTIGVWSRFAGSDAILVLDKRLRGHGARVTRANFLDVTANRVVSSSADELNRLWNLETLDDDERQIKDAFHLTRIPQRSTISRIAAAGISRNYLLTAFRPDGVGRTKADVNAGTTQTDFEVFTVCRHDEPNDKADVPAASLFAQSGPLI